MKLNKKIIASLLVVVAALIVSPFIIDKYNMQKVEKASKERVDEVKPMLEAYAKEHYSNLEYTIKDIYPIYKANRVYMDIDVKNSEDKDFSIYIDEKNEIHSTYQEVIEEKASAASRVNEYLLELEQKELSKFLLGDNYDMEFIFFDWDTWQKNPPKLDESIEELLKQYKINLEINAKDMSTYSKKEIEDLKSKVKDLYTKEGITIHKISFRDLKSQEVY